MPPYFIIYFLEISTISFAPASMPQWISAIAAFLGVPVAIIGIVKLFKRDEEKEEKLKYMINQISELQKQTSEFGLQTNLMKEANVLIEKQMEWQVEVYSKSQNQEETKLKFEKHKRMNDIKPRFVCQGSSYSFPMLNVNLVNKGGQAKDVKVESIDNEFIEIIPLTETHSIDPGQLIVLRGKPSSTNQLYNISNLTYKITISFCDVDDNKYFQEISNSINGYFAGSPYEHS